MHVLKSKVSGEWRNTHAWKNKKKLLFTPLPRRPSQRNRQSHAQTAQAGCIYAFFAGKRMETETFLNEFISGLDRDCV